MAGLEEGWTREISSSSWRGRGGSWKRSCCCSRTRQMGSTLVDSDRGGLRAKACMRARWRIATSSVVEERDPFHCPGRGLRRASARTWLLSAFCFLLSADCVSSLRCYCWLFPSIANRHMFTRVPDELDVWSMRRLGLVKEQKRRCRN